MIAAISSCSSLRFHHIALFFFLLCSLLFPHLYLVLTSTDSTLILSVFQLQPEQLDCGAAHLQHPLALRRPLRATPLVEYPGLTSVSADYVHNHTVVFLGTSNGRLRKVRQLRAAAHMRTHESF